MAAQVTEELKTVTYATPPMEERRGKLKKEMNVYLRNNLLFQLLDGHSGVQIHVKVAHH